uniref:CUB domain-containing protein n=1 Tax=Romanomermis culicivorax TaxID=13658 RepID=A0A915LAG8_ROMCU
MARWIGDAIMLTTLWDLVIILADQRTFFSYFDAGKLCEFNITSRKNGKTGVLQSPNYPRQYDPNIRCEYHFMSVGQERVQLIFTDFDLYHPANLIKNDTKYIEPPICRDDNDHVSAFVELNGRMSQLGTFCGEELPSQLMSSRSQISLEFVSHHHFILLSHASRPYRGFQLTYRFVTDFAMESGEKDSKRILNEVYRSIPNLMRFGKQIFLLAVKKWGAKTLGKCPSNSACENLHKNINKRMLEETKHQEKENVNKNEDIRNK